MRFDDIWPDDDAFASSDGALPMVPAGRHSGTIVDAKWKRVTWNVSDANKDGLSLVLTVSVRNHQPVEAIIPAHFRGKLEAICKSAGVTAPVRGVDWHEQTLMDRPVVIETVQAVSKSGREYVRVEKWHASPINPAVAKAKPEPLVRGQAQRAAKAHDADDIPF